ncbi:hypothetical protein [Campylobacter concisus]|uniref:hypothetical protein n=1 Tax=Campylobacter concisus TaxID=199 RepID=UPI00112F9549|nr:hypothetical protein [Campylobacter concisus]
MGWDCSQKLTHSPHPDKPSHYLLWPLLVFELTPPLLSKKPNRTEHRTLATWLAKPCAFALAKIATNNNPSYRCTAPFVT